MTLDDLKARARRAFAAATVKCPGGVIPKYIEAIEALPDRTLFDSLAPEFRAPFEEHLEKLGIRPAPTRPKRRGR